MNGPGRASANTRAVAPFRNHGLSLRGDDVAHENRADHAAELQRLAPGAPEADAGHEIGRVLILVGGHGLAGVDVDAVTDGGPELVWRGAALQHGSRPAPERTEGCSRSSSWSSRASRWPARLRGRSRRNAERLIAPPAIRPRRSPRSATEQVSAIVRHANRVAATVGWQIDQKLSPDRRLTTQPV